MECYLDVQKKLLFEYTSQGYPLFLEILESRLLSILAGNLQMHQLKNYMYVPFTTGNPSNSNQNFWSNGKCPVFVRAP